MWFTALARHRFDNVALVVALSLYADDEDDAANADLSFSNPFFFDKASRRDFSVSSSRHQRRFRAFDVLFRRMLSMQYHSFKRQRHER